MNTMAYITGDKFPRNIEIMETGEATAKRLVAAGYEPTYFMASRASKRGGSQMVAMVMRNAKTGEYVFAL